MQVRCFQIMSTRTYQKIACFWVLVPALTAAAAQVGSIAPDFTIKDQYDLEVQLSLQRGKPVLLIYGDRLGSDYMSVWAAAMRESPVASSVNVIRIANLRAVPAAFHRYVKRKFQSPNEEGMPNSPVLLDFDGAVAKIFGFTDDLTNVYLIDKKGILRYTACGKGTPEQTRRLLDVIAQLDQTELRQY
jgi:hypothetical protein